MLITALHYTSDSKHSFSASIAEFSLCNCPRQHCDCISAQGSALKVFNVPSSSEAGHTPHGAPTGLKLSHPTLQKSTKQGKWNRPPPGLSASSVWFSEDSDTAPTSKAKGLRTICITVLVEKLEPQDAGRPLRASDEEVGFHTGSVGFVVPLDPLSPSNSPTED